MFEVRENSTGDYGASPLSLPGSLDLGAMVNEATQRVANVSRGEMRQLLTGFLVILTLLGLFRKVVVAKFHLREFSGPWWAAYTRVWISKTIASADSAQIFVETNEKHGSIARIGPNHLVTSDPAVARRILAVGSKWRRGPWFDAIRIDPRVPNIVSERDPHKHNTMRRTMSAGYAGKDIDGLEDVVNERVKEFIDSLEKRALSAPGQTGSFDIARRIQFFTIDTITHVCFGRPMGFVQSDTDKHDFIATIESQLPIAQHFSVFLALNTMLRWAASIAGLRKAVVPSPADKSGIGVVMRASPPPSQYRPMRRETRANSLP